MTKKNDEYKISTLEGMEAVRKLTGMYLGDTETGQALMHAFVEILDNSIDEYLAGYANHIVISLHKDGSASVLDNGRGIPTYWIEDQKMSALESVLTKLHSGGKFNDKDGGYKMSMGVHGVGCACSNAVSARFRAIVYRDGKEYTMAFAKGKKIEELSERKINSTKTGTLIRFAPDLTIFKNVTQFDPEQIKTKLRQLSYLCKGLTIEFIDERNETKEVFSGDAGIADFVKFLAKDKLLSNPISLTDTKNDIIVDVALQWLDGSDSEISYYFTNNIPNPDGGSHTVGFKAGLTRTINNYISASDLPKTFKISLSGDDVREGLVAVVSIRHPSPRFSSQTKEKLVSEDARTAVENTVSIHLLTYLEQNPTIAKKIVTRCINAFKAREAARKARETVRKSSLTDSILLPGKLADCTSKDPEECELFLVEGQSAGGCFSGDTEVALVDGRNLSFIDIIKEQEEGKEHYCYTIRKNGQIGIQKITNPHKTKTSNIIAVYLDNNKIIKCTPDHKFMLRDGNYKEAKDLTEGDSLMPLYRKLSNIKDKGITINGYEMTWCPKNNYWYFTHVLSDWYNRWKNIYSKKDGTHCHHKNFNKLDNNPTNIIRIDKEAHWQLHMDNLQYSLHSKETKEKSKKAHQTPEYKEFMSKRMREPETRKILSDQAKEQWKDEKYKEFMKNKWRDFYNNNEEYRKYTLEQLFSGQKEYWANEENRLKESKRRIQFYKDHPEVINYLSKIAKNQWKNKELLQWRREKTREQWTPEFRSKRKIALNRTYYQKTIQALKDIFDKTGSLETYDEWKKQKRDNSYLNRETFINRYFNGDVKAMEDAVKNHNHKVLKIEYLPNIVDVYDLEVPNSHNFALASGVFVHNSCKIGRDRFFQAVLPLRGKVLNIEKCEYKKMLENKEILSLIAALGTGVGKSFDLSKLRYNKVFLTMDADIDGSHIRTLLLTFFFRQMPQLIEAGYLYIAVPPLYRIDYHGKTYYIKNEKELNTFLKERKLDRDRVKISRFKGLGEMMAEQLWETTLNPETRTILKVLINNYAEADKIFSMLMGDQIEVRKEFILQNSNIAHLDI